MTKAELKALKETMPWRYESKPDGIGMRIIIYDKNNNEVDLAKLIQFVCLVSRTISKQ